MECWSLQTYNIVMKEITCASVFDVEAVTTLKIKKKWDNIGELQLLKRKNQTCGCNLRVNVIFKFILGYKKRVEALVNETRW